MSKIKQKRLKKTQMFTNHLPYCIKNHFPTLKKNYLITKKKKNLNSLSGKHIT